MIPYDIDPSLYTSEPEPPSLDDGFSPPDHSEPPPVQKPSPSADIAPAIGDQSAF